MHFVGEILKFLTFPVPSELKLPFHWYHHAGIIHAGWIIKIHHKVRSIRTQVFLYIISSCENYSSRVNYKIHKILHFIWTQVACPNPALVLHIIIIWYYVCNILYRHYIASANASAPSSCIALVLHWPSWGLHLKLESRQIRSICLCQQAFGFSALDCTFISFISHKITFSITVTYIMIYYLPVGLRFFCHNIPYASL